MANEVQVVAQLSCNNGNYRLPKTGINQSFDQAAPGGGPPGQIIVPVAGMDITVTGITVPGWCRMQNLDETNYVEWGTRQGGSNHFIGRMEPGEPALFRVAVGAGDTFRIKANTAPCKVQVIILEN